MPNGSSLKVRILSVCFKRYFVANNVAIMYFFAFAGFPITTIIVMFVTYCLIQVIKEKERRQALIDDPDPLPPATAATSPAAAAAAPTAAAPAAATAAAAAPPAVDPSKQKAE